MPGLTPLETVVVFSVSLALFTFVIFITRLYNHLMLHCSLRKGLAVTTNLSMHLAMIVYLTGGNWQK